MDVDAHDEVGLGYSETADELEQMAVQTQNPIHRIIPPANHAFSPTSVVRQAGSGTTPPRSAVCRYIRSKDLLYPLV